MYFKIGLLFWAEAEIFAENKTARKILIIKII